MQSALSAADFKTIVVSLIYLGEVEAATVLSSEGVQMGA